MAYDERPIKSDLLDELWLVVAQRFDFLEGVVVVSSNEGRAMRVLSSPVVQESRGIVELLPGSLVASVCSQAQKLKFGKVSCITAFFDEVCVVLFDCNPLVLAFVTRGDTTPAQFDVLKELAPQFSAILELRRPT